MHDIKLEIPFQGFCNSIHSALIDDAFEQEHTDDDGELDSDAHHAAHDTINWQAVMIEYAKYYVEQLNEELDFELTFNQLHSPREYNFETDTIEVLIAQDDLDTVFKILCAKHNQALREHIRDALTERSGFIPNYSNEFDDWLDQCVYEPAALATPQITLLLEVYIKECSDFDETHCMDDVNSNGDLSEWIHSAIKTPEPEPEPRTIDVAMNHFDNAVSQRDAVKNLIMRFASPNLLTDELDVRDSHNVEHTNFATVMDIPYLHSAELTRALTDDNRYLDVFAMCHRPDDPDGKVSSLAGRGETPDYYDFMVRGDADNEDLSDVIYYEAENVAPDDAECVQQVIERTFNLNSVYQTANRFVVQGRRESNDDHTVIINASTLDEAIAQFVENILDQTGDERDEDYFIIAADTLENFLTNRKLEIQ